MSFSGRPATISRTYQSMRMIWNGWHSCAITVHQLVSSTGRDLLTSPHSLRQPRRNMTRLLPFGRSILRLSGVWQSKFLSEPERSSSRKSARSHSVIETSLIIRFCVEHQDPPLSFQSSHSNQPSGDLTARPFSLRELFESRAVRNGLKQVLQSDREEFTRPDPASPNGPGLARPPRRYYRGAPPDRVYKLLIRPEARREILRELHRMNISYATLYPGLDGFARSLGTTVTMSEFSCLDFDPEVDLPI